MNCMRRAARGNSRRAGSSNQEQSYATEKQKIKTKTIPKKELGFRSWGSMRKQIRRFRNLKLEVLESDAVGAIQPAGGPADMAFRHETLMEDPDLATGFWPIHPEVERKRRRKSGLDLARREHAGFKSTFWREEELD